VNTLVIDNYDSFTYNLVHLLTVVNGQEPTVVRNDEASWSDLERRGFDNVVISPGPGRPDRPRDFGVARDAVVYAGIPVLGVCLGHQGIAAFNGAAIVRADTLMHGRVSTIWHDGSALFNGVPSPLEVARYHSLVVARPLPDVLVETARTGDGTIMGIAHRTRPQWGVQFHPESILSEYGRRILENFRDLTLAVDVPRSFALGSAAPQPPPTRSVPTRRCFWRELTVPINAEAAFVTLYGDAPTAFWLDSSLVEAGRSRWSYLGAARDGEPALTYSYEARAHSGRTSVFDALDRPAATLENPPPCPFQGGHVGWLGYELRRELSCPHDRAARTPDALFLYADRFIAVDHLAGRTYAVAIDAMDRPADAQRWVEATVARLARLETPQAPSLPDPDAARTTVRFRLDRDRERYLVDIERALDWIAAGETYQVCLTNEIVTTCAVDPLTLYRVTRRVNPAPHAAYLRWSGGAVISSSPERFLQVDAGGQVETKPIKGTISRDADPACDSALAQRLRASEKDRAENAMIVDLLRNDLSRVCEAGSVVVPTLCGIESFASVHQLVSTVRGTLRPGRTVVDLLRATFPGGSMTGAPKQRTLELIDRLEERARGIYSGTLGWIGDDGAADLSIVIRTIVATGSTLSIGVGGGIVAQSTPEGEFEEMLLKAQTSIRAIVTTMTGAYAADRFSIEGTQPVARQGVA
jgi:para-aminobenzoate synthetase